MSERVAWVDVAKGICIVIQDVLVGNVVELTTMSLRKECFRRTLALGAIQKPLAPG